MIKIPLNYTHPKYEYLNFNYEKLFSDISELNFFENKEINNLFLKHWKTLLISADFNSKKDFRMKFYKNTEHFPIPLFFNGLLIGSSAINIDKTEERIYQEQLKPQKISMNYFFEKKQFLKLDVHPYEQKHALVYNHYSRNTNVWPIPIIIFDTEYSNHAVTIDGNHRVSYCLNINSSQSIDSYTLNETFFNHESLFMDNYSFLIFTFWKEIHFFLNDVNHNYFLSKTKFYNKRLLSKYSYLSNIISN